MEGDRRRHERLRVSLPAFVFEGRTGRASATVTDVSSTGLCVSASDCEAAPDIEEAGSFEAAFFAPGVQWPIVLRCRVVWRKENGETREMGGEFFGGDPGSHLALQEYLVSRRRKPYAG